MTDIDEILDGVYRIATFDDKIGMFFNQYLIKDEKNTLIHTGSTPIFEGVLKCIAQILDPADIAYAFISHFEADECGALQRLMGLAKGVRPVGSGVTARQLLGFGICGNCIALKEGDVLDLGRRKLGFVTYPSEMHLWDGLLAYEQVDRILFTSDLFIRRGLTDAPLVPARADDVLNIPSVAIPWAEGREACLAKLKALNVDIFALGHGPALDARRG